MPRKRSSHAYLPRRPRGASLAHAIDAQVGARLRMGRQLRGMSMEQIAEALKISYQQVQKYEKGRNRISASRLYELTSILGVPITFFFESINRHDSLAAGSRPDNATGMLDKMSNRETLELIKTYYRIENPKIRKKVLALARLLADKGEA